MKPKMHFALFTFPPYVDHYAESWRHPEFMHGGLYTPEAPEVWQREARLLQDMLFDAWFVGDVGAVFNSHQDKADLALRMGTQSVQFFAPLMAQVVADAAPELGVICTVSTGELHPWTAARLLNSMDHLTKGRVGWNVVTGLNPGLTQNLGAELMEHDLRYERCEEYLEVCYKLWESWETNAMVRDAAGGIFVDPGKVHQIDHEGEFFKSRGPLTMPRSPQTYPVIVQAGQSPRGRDLAAKHAEVVFSISPSLPAMQRFYQDVKGRAEKFGRRPEDIAILPGIMPIVGATEAEANEKYELMRSIATVDAGLAWVSGYTGWDFSAYSHDTPVSQLDPTKFHGMQSAFQLSNPNPGSLDSTPYMRKGPETDDPTIAELGMGHAEGVVPKIVGTPSQVADQLEQLFDEGGCDGFMVSAAHHPVSVEEFAPVIAELQRRGRYRTAFEGPTMRERLGTVPLPLSRAR